MTEKPAEKYIKRNLETATVTVRIDKEVKEDADRASRKLDTSLNRFVEASMKWFIDKLKKDGDL